MLADILPLEQDAETVANEYEETFGISFVTVLPVRANLDAQLAWLSQPSQGGSGSSCAPGSQERLAVMEQHKRYLIAFITAVQSWLALGRPAPLPSPPAAPAGVPAANAAAADVGGGGSSGGGAQLVSSSAGTQQASTSGAQHVPGTSGTPTGLVSSTSGGGGGGGGERSADQPRRQRPAGEGHWTCCSAASNAADVAAPAGTPWWCLVVDWLTVPLCRNNLKATRACTAPAELFLLGANAAAGSPDGCPPEASGSAGRRVFALDLLQRRAVSGVASEVESWSRKAVEQS
ncbi:hypothetical protein HXX76_014603 [Chlamydomonas incerta]|uniref:Uncharacterized protein n=1 Tax=Chlamydomonas incerta TaxID=51695 RepID=A0A835VT00_CHLIN|nr:hypothetical protein HXX76_014603 [Chlamydomonas incerta]|eukprot:KAG2424394.1 hypothetical protein HXX76_014603 [Chlamydomonas incerta]